MLIISQSFCEGGIAIESRFLCSNVQSMKAEVGLDPGTHIPTPPSTHPPAPSA